MRSLMLIVFLFAAGAVQAVPITWTLQDVTFYDGGTATGSFDYDADTDTVTNIDITVSAGSSALWTWEETDMVFSNVLFNANAGSDYVGFLSPEVLSEDDDPSGPPVFDPPEWSLILAVAGGFPSSVGTYALTAGSPNTQSGSGFGERVNFINAPDVAADSYRHIVSGSVTAVPIPAAAWLFASGLGLLGWARRR